MRALEFLTSHDIYNPVYTYKFQLKTTQDFDAIQSWAFTPVTPNAKPDFMIGPLETNKTISWAIYPDR